MARYGRHEKKRGGIIRLWDTIVFAATLVFGLLLLFAYLTRFVNPNAISFFSLVGFVAPILYVLNMVFALYWAVRWKVYFFIPVVVLLLGIGNLTLFFRPAVSKHYADSKAKKLRLMTFNAMGFIYEDEKGDVRSSIDGIARFLSEQNPDIVCFQEFQAKSREQKQDMDRLFDIRYSKHSYIKENSAGGGWGLAIYSKYRILDWRAITYPASNNSSMWADILIENDTIRIYNNHLQTTSVNYLDRKYISNQEFRTLTSDNEERMKGIVGKLRRNNMIRAAQVDSLALLLKASPHRLIVCGDFNDTPMSYTYFTLRKGLDDAFVKQGHGLTSNTFKGLFNLFRIDYVLYSKDFNAVSYATPENEYSDHKPVVVDFSLPLVGKQ